MEYESSTNIEHLSNIYTDGEKYYWVLYSGHRYYFDDIGYEWEDHAERELMKKITEIENQ